MPHAAKQPRDLTLRVICTYPRIVTLTVSLLGLGDAISGEKARRDGGQATKESFVSTENPMRLISGRGSRTRDPPWKAEEKDVVV
jgi:hypothetical protein